MSSKKVLVTGGAGFIGNHLVDRLVKDGHQVTVLDNFLRGNKLDKDTMKNIALIEGDVRDEAIVLKAAEKCDWIFHFAAVLGVDVVADNPVETMETEFFGMKNVMKAAIENSTEKIIYASTSGVYGKAAIEQAVNEDFMVAPNSSYAIAKRFNEIYLAALYQEKQVNSVSLRFFNVYGPKQDNRMVTPRFFEQAIKNEPITVFGDGKQTRDFTFIDDTVEGIVRSAEKINGCEIINISNNKEYTIKELAEAIKEITASKSEIAYITPPSGRYDFEVERRFGSSQKLKNKVGFAPNMPLKKGLEKIYNYTMNKK